MTYQFKRRNFFRKALLAIFLTIIVSLSTTGCAAYNALRTRPMGDGPAGPVIAAEPFSAIWSSKPVVFLGIGDSVTRGFGAAKQHTYFELLIKNDNKMYPDMKGRDLSIVFPGMTWRNYAQDYTTTQQHLDWQLSKIPTYGKNIHGIIVMTSGGNDLIHNYGRTAPEDGAMYGCTMEQARVWCENLKQRLNTLLMGLTAKFPGGCDIFLANIYDPSDGYGDPQTIGLPRWSDSTEVLALTNRKIAELCEQYPNVHLVDIHTPFLGHGIHCDEKGRSTYRKDDPHYWYYSNLEDPNRRGFDAIRRLFLQEMIRVYCKP